MRTTTKLAAAAALLSAAVPAHAAPIIGQINLIGFVRPIGSTTMETATGLDFYNFLSLPSNANDGGTPGTIFAALGSTGVFAGIACAGPCGTIKDLPTFATGPIASFFDVGSTIFFDLGSINSVTYSNDGSGGSLKVIASGTFRATGFDDTAGRFTLTTQGSGLTSFSATALSPVPEPASWALMIAGFGMMGGMLRAARRSVRVRYSTN
jgi:hypothetical protein